MKYENKSVSHNIAVSMNIIITKEMNCLIRNSCVRLVWEIAMHAFVKSMPVIVIRRCICRFVQILGSIWIVFGVVWEGPKLGFPSSSPHYFQHFRLLHISSHCYLLLIHVDFQAVYPCIQFTNMKMDGRNILEEKNEVLPSIFEIALRILFSHPSQSMCTASSTIYIWKETQWKP